MFTGLENSNCRFCLKNGTIKLGIPVVLYSTGKTGNNLEFNAEESLAFFPVFCGSSSSSPFCCKETKPPEPGNPSYRVCLKNDTKCRASLLFPAQRGKPVTDWI